MVAFHKLYVNPPIREKIDILADKAFKANALPGFDINSYTILLLAYQANNRPRLDLDALLIAPLEDVVECVQLLNEFINVDTFKYENKQPLKYTEK
jgi:hypothetical protein